MASGSAKRRRDTDDTAMPTKTHKADPGLPLVGVFAMADSFSVYTVISTRRPPADPWEAKLLLRRPIATAPGTWSTTTLGQAPMPGMFNTPRAEGDAMTEVAGSRGSLICGEAGSPFSDTDGSILEFELYSGTARVLVLPMTNFIWNYGADGRPTKYTAAAADGTTPTFVLTVPVVRRFPACWAEPAHRELESIGLAFARDLILGYVG